jgi:hypothetical protein
VECIRGGNRAVARIFYNSYSLSIGLVICYIFVTMYIVYKNIHNIEEQAQRYSFARYYSQKINTDRSRRVMVQGVLYSSVLILTNVFTAAAACFVSYMAVLPYALAILVHIFMPLQGFFNAMIYSIPVFQRMYRRRKERKNAVVEIQKSKEKITKSRHKHNQFGCNISKPTSHLNNNSNEDKSDKTAIHDEQYCHQPALNKEFDGEEEKEEIQQIRDGTADIHPGLIYDESQMKKKAESNSNDSVEYCSFDHHDTNDGIDDDIDVCYEEEQMGEGPQEMSRYYVSPRHVGNDDIDDIDDYLALALMDNRPTTAVPSGRRRRSVWF